MNFKEKLTNSLLVASAAIGIAFVYSVVKELAVLKKATYDEDAEIKPDFSAQKKPAPDTVAESDNDDTDSDD